MHSPLEYVLICPTTGKALSLGVPQKLLRAALRTVHDCPHCHTRHTGEVKETLSPQTLSLTAGSVLPVR